MENWIPVSSGKYPKDGEVVQVTYLSYYDKKPLCNAFAFRRDGVWIWDTLKTVKVEIVAWKMLCDPYNPYNDHIGEIPRWSWISNLIDQLILTSIISHRVDMYS